MRRILSVVHTTALEILSEPLTLLILLAALVLAVLAPAFHYHQFGEATRMARDAGFSATLVGGSVLAVFGTIRSVRREVETGTLEMALARPIARATFVLAKMLGAWLATVVLAGIIFATTLVMVEGAAVGGRIAEQTGDIACIWGPCLALGVAVMILPLVLAAALNRFASFRFVLTALVLSGIISLVSGGWALMREKTLLLPYLLAAVPLTFLFAVLSASATALSFRFKAHTAAALTGLVIAVGLPFIGNAYFADALSNGGTVSIAQVGLSALAALPALAAFLLLGCRGCEECTQRE